MPKTVDKLKEAKLKQARLKGCTGADALRQAGYSENTATHEVGRQPTLKHVDEIIQQEWKLSDVTVEQVVKEIDEVRALALEKGDLSTAGRMSELKGRYLAMFTDKRMIDHKVMTSEDQAIIDAYMPKGNSSNRVGDLLG